MQNEQMLFLLLGALPRIADGDQRGAVMGGTADVEPRGVGGGIDFAAEIGGGIAFAAAACGGREGREDCQEYLLCFHRLQK